MRMKRGIYWHTWRGYRQCRHFKVCRSRRKRFNRWPRPAISPWILPAPLDIVHALLSLDFSDDYRTLSGSASQGRIGSSFQ